MNKFELNKNEAAFIAFMLTLEYENLKPLAKDLLFRLIRFSSDELASMLADVLAKEI